MSLFPKSLAQVVEPLVRPVLKTRGLAGTAIITDWPRIAGPQLSAHCLPEKLSFPPGQKIGGTLTLSVENGFATEVQHMQPLILERINLYFGYAAVARLSIRHALPRPAKAKAPAPKLASSKPLSPDDCRCLDGISDQELKTSLQSLAKSLSGQ